MMMTCQFALVAGGRWLISIGYGAGHKAISTFIAAHHAKNQSVGRYQKGQSVADAANFPGGFAMSERMKCRPERRIARTGLCV